MSNNKCVFQQITISNLLIIASVGINPDELINKQPILISVTLETNFDKSNDIARIVDYSKIIATVKCIVGSKHFNLLENLCSVIGRKCLDFNNVKSAKVEISKPNLCIECDKISVLQIWK